MKGYDIVSIKIWKDNGLCNGSITSSVECLKNSEMQIVLYTLQRNETINIVPDGYSVTTTLIILEGLISMHSSDEVYELGTHDAAMLIDIEKSYFVEAMKFTKIIAISSEENQDTQEDKAIVSMLGSVEEKDVYTLGHNRRVSLYAKQLALAYESTYNVITLSSAACMHDIGKINTPVEILQKPGKLTEEEFDIIKKHPRDSYEILKDIIGEKAAIAAGQHHERLDGSGYPNGLCGDKICMDAKIIAIADVFDAMTCKRIYNEPSPPIEVVKYLEANLDKYDEAIVAILRRKVETGKLDNILTAFHAQG